jgi:hypothetical protein
LQQACELGLAIWRQFSCCQSSDNFAEGGQRKIDISELFEVRSVDVLAFMNFFAAGQVAQVELHALNRKESTLYDFFDGKTYSMSRVNTV